MGELWFISLGLQDERDMSLRALEIAKSCEELYVEFYTTKLDTNEERLSRLLGKPVKVLSRAELEENSDRFLESIKGKKIGLLVGGDALVATTHCALRVEAERKGIKTNVVHGSSILSAIAESGLHVYKFGKVITVPLPHRTKALPYSVYEAIKLNLAMGLHSLLLLDVEAEECLTPQQAIELLLRMETERREGVFTEETELIVFKAGEMLVWGKAKELKQRDFGKPPWSLVVPAALHFSEQEYLETLALKIVTIK